MFTRRIKKRGWDVVIIFTKTSLQDLKEIMNKISYYNMKKTYILNLLNYIKILEEMPYIGKVISKSKFHNIRQLIFRKHKIIYQIENDKIYIHAIVNNSKNFFFKKLYLFL